MQVTDIKPRQLVWQSAVLNLSPAQNGSVTIGSPILRQYKSQLEIPEGSVEQPAWQSYGMAAQALDARYCPNGEVAFYVQCTDAQLSTLDATLTMYDYGTDGFSGALNNAGMVTTRVQSTTANVTAEFIAGRGYIVVPMVSVQVGQIQLTITQRGTEAIELKCRVEAFARTDFPISVGGPKNGVPSVLVPEMANAYLVSCPSGGTTTQVIDKIVTARANALTVLVNSTSAVTVVVRCWFAGHNFYVDQTFGILANTPTAQTFTSGLGREVEILVTHNGGGAAASVTVEAIARS